MKLKILFFLFFCFQSFTVYGTVIRVIDLQYIIDNNTAILNLIKEIDNDQKSHRKNFKENEIALNLELERIEELKLILSNTELDKEINRMENRQMAIKILLNSLYGALGNKHFAHFDVRLAEGVTLS